MAFWRLDGRGRDSGVLREGGGPVPCANAYDSLPLAEAVWIVLAVPGRSYARPSDRKGCLTYRLERRVAFSGLSAPARRSRLIAWLRTVAIHNPS